MRTRRWYSCPSRVSFASLGDSTPSWRATRLSSQEAVTPLWMITSSAASYSFSGSESSSRRLRERPGRHADPSRQVRGPGRDVAEAGIVAVHRLVLFRRLGVQPPRLVDGAELELQGVARRGREVGQFEALLEMPDRGFGIVSFRFAQPEHGERVRRACAGAVAERDLELRDRLVEKPHLPVRDAETVMGLHVFRPYQLLHLGAELPQ